MRHWSLTTLSILSGVCLLAGCKQPAGDPIWLGALQ